MDSVHVQTSSTQCAFCSRISLSGRYVSYGASPALVHGETLFRRVEVPSIARNASVLTFFILVFSCLTNLAIFVDCCVFLVPAFRAVRALGSSRRTCKCSTRALLAISRVVERTPCPSAAWQTSRTCLFVHVAPPTVGTIAAAGTVSCAKFASSAIFARTLADRRVSLNKVSTRAR